MNIKFVVFRCAQWIVLCLISLGATSVMATCKYRSNGVVNITSIYTERNAAIGSLIGEAESADLQPFTCSGNDGHQELGVQSVGTPAGMTSSDGATIYRLGPQSTGVGYTIQGIGGSVCPGATTYVDGQAPFITTSVNKLLCSSGTSSFPGPITARIKLRFYKIANTIPATSLPTQVLAAFVMNSDSGWTDYKSDMYISAVKISASACSLATTNVAVPMGTVNSSDFTTEGSTARNTAFIVTLNCDANTKVGITFNAGAAGAYDSARGLLNLESASSVPAATGVKLQMLYNEAPLTLNSLIQTGTVATQGAYPILLKARYYRSAGSIIGGPANASATMTISYQ